MTECSMPFNSVVQLVNKVAGVYGLIAVVTGAGGSFGQLSLYIYSVLALIVLVWGLRRVKEVCRPTIYLPFEFSYVDRKIPVRRPISRTFFSQTTSSPRYGPSPLLSTGGCSSLTTAVDKPTRMLRNG